MIETQSRRVTECFVEKRYQVPGTIGSCGRFVRTGCRDRERKHRLTVRAGIIPSGAAETAQGMRLQPLLRALNACSLMCKFR